MEDIWDHEDAMLEKIRKCFINFFDFMGPEEGLQQYADFKEAAFRIDDTNDRRVFLQHRLLSMTSSASKHRCLGDPKIIYRCFDKILMAKKRLHTSNATPGKLQDRESGIGFDCLK